MSGPLRVDGVLFDKDGTLFDFSATWDVWALGVFEQFSAGDADVLRDLARVACYNLDEARFEPTSPVIAGTNREAAECLASALPARSVDEIEDILRLAAADAPLAQAVPLAPFLDGLRARGLALGVMTNDTEFGAFAHLRNAGVDQRFDFVAGFDSGFGAKPSPEPLLAFAEHVSLAPERVVMVGDSTHDLIAGRSAGMLTVGVLTGPANKAELAPFADAVLPNIGHLDAWIQA